MWTNLNCIGVSNGIYFMKHIQICVSHLQGHMSIYIYDQSNSTNTLCTTSTQYMYKNSSKKRYNIARHIQEECCKHFEACCKLYSLNNYDKLA